MVLDLYNIIHVVRIIVAQMQKNLKLYLGLVFEFLLVSNNFHSHNLASLVVNAAKRLTKWTFSQKPEHLKAIPQVIPNDYAIVALVIIVAVIVLFARLTRNLFYTTSYEVYRLKVKYFCLFEIS